MQKDQNFSEDLPHEHTPRLPYDPLAEHTAPLETHLHFKTFQNSIFISKTDINKTAWINARK